MKIASSAPKGRDIYGLEKKLAAAKRYFLAGAKLQRTGKNKANPWAARHTSEHNKKLILEYEEHLKFLGRSMQTRYKFFCTLANLTTELEDRDFDKLTKEDVKAYIAELNTGRFAPKTAQIKKLALKCMVRWLAKEKEVPSSIKLWGWLDEAVKTTLPIRSIEESVNIEKEYLLSEEEALDFIRSAKGKDRAFLFTLYDSGARIGELLPLKKRDVKFDKGGYALLTLQGKTGKREVPVKACVPDLAHWINELGGDMEQDLWVVEGTRGAGGRYDYRSMMRRVYQLGRYWQATKPKPWNAEQLRKKLHLHNWRHSRATALAKRGWSEYEMCTFFGWKIGSKVPGVYVSLSGRDLKRRMMLDEGDAEEKPEPSKLKSIKCPACNAEESAANRICSKCGMALTQAEFAVQLEKRRRLEDKLDKVGKLLDMLSENTGENIPLEAMKQVVRGGAPVVQKVQRKK